MVCCCYIFFAVIMTCLHFTVAACNTVDGDNKGHCGIEYCKTTIPNELHSQYCHQERVNDIRKAQKWYILTEQGKPMVSPKQYSYIPLLNQTKAATVYNTAIDPLESRWLSMTLLLDSSVIKKVTGGLMQRFAGNAHLSYEQFKTIYYAFQAAVKNMHTPQYYGNPTMYKEFYDTIGNDQYLTDKVFTEKFLGGTCPFLLHKITTKGRTGINYSKITRLLNTKHNFGKYVSDAYNRNKVLFSAYRKFDSLYQVANEKRLYVYYEEDSNDLKNQVDAERLSNPQRRMLEATSPIVLFVRDELDELKVAAIQIDYKSDSEVFTPQSNPIDWLITKGRTQMAYLTVCQGKYHLGHMHYLSPTLFCIVFRRHLSPKHPLYTIMQYHCEGSVPHITITADAPFDPQGPIAVSLNVGAEGLADYMVRKAYMENEYGFLDFDKIMNRRGLLKDKLSYYPFRDDGKLIWKSLHRFAKDFVNSFYKSNSHVRGDWELQAFVKGILTSDANRQLPGFPSQFRRKSDVTVFVTRFIWNAVFHSVVNYANNPYLAFLPHFPSKMYNNSRLEARNDYAYSLASATTGILFSTFTNAISNLRVNRIFDYYDRVESKKLKIIVRKHYSKMHGCIQKILEKRNAQRKCLKQLTYQYLEPKWLTSSIHA